MLLSKLKIENGRAKTKDSIRITIEVDGEVNKTSNEEEIK
jgi:pentose-5-phosphate-3-epimerase